MIVKKAYAKINVALDVLSKRTDGMHEVDMIMTPLLLHDTLHFELLLDCSDIVVTVEPDIIGKQEDNLVYRAALLLQQQYSVTNGCRIYIDKKIPMAAGLAGGSSDAAATLQALNELWELSLSSEQLEALAIQLGADVPYCLYHETTRARGIGELLAPITSLQPVDVVLLKPHYGISTKVAYANSVLDQQLPWTVQEVQDAIEKQDYEQLCLRMFNRFEISTFANYPDLAKVKQSIQGFADVVLLSGSGPTLFAFVTQAEMMQKIQEVAQEYDFRIIQTRLK